MRGIIRNSRIEWTSPVGLTRKSDGSYRFRIDFREVDGVTRVRAYPSPHRNVTLRNVQHANYLSVSDSSGAFWQIPLTERSIPVTAFTVLESEPYEFVRMPYGFTGASATFRMLAVKLTSSEMKLYASAYLDDVIYGHSQKVDELHD